MALALGLWSYTEATGTNVTLCYKTNGQMRILTSGQSACAANETALHLNTNGAPGTGPNYDDEIAELSAKVEALEDLTTQEFINVHVEPSFSGGQQYATVKWNTKIAAKRYMLASTTPPDVSDITSYSGPEYDTQHALGLLEGSELQPNTTYYYVLFSLDTLGRLTHSQTYTYQTNQ